MTNKEAGSSDGGEAGCDSRLAALLAVHLVSQVLDEAYVLANDASESGDPWRYLAMLKDLRTGRLGGIEEDNITICPTIIDDDVKLIDGDHTMNKTMDAAANAVVTSTPHKSNTKEKAKIPKETSFIGQGDEDMRKNELAKSTSMFINQLFDMSEVECIIIGDDVEVVQSDLSDLNIAHMTEIMESYVNTAFEIALGQESSVIKTSHVDEVSSESENSAYSFLSDANNINFDYDNAFCEDCEAINNKVLGITTLVENVEIHQEEAAAEEAKLGTIKKDDVAFYENTYLTLNRDYDQCSDEGGIPNLQDTKVLSLQEVELIVNTSNENLSRAEEPVQPKIKEPVAVAVVSASANGSRKSSLVQKCRTQGAKFLSRLRGWWRRKTPGKRKENRALGGSVRGLCPLSPDARRRAASLLDQRKQHSSSPASEHVFWKFNTVSEALVNSSRWKDYTFEVISDKCGEY